MHKANCRYCKHLKNTQKPRAKFVGRCEFGLHADTCGKFELADCFGGEDPRDIQIYVDAQW